MFASGEEVNHNSTAGSSTVSTNTGNAGNQGTYEASAVDAEPASTQSSSDVPSAASAAGLDEATTTSTTITERTTTTAGSWTWLRGEPTSTTTTLFIVEGYEVWTDEIEMRGNPAADAYTVGGIDVFVDSAEKFWWVLHFEGAWPPTGLRMPSGDDWGDGSWDSEEGKVPVEVADGSGPASVAWETGYTDVFVRGADNALYHRRGTTTWLDWENLGGLLTSDPAVASRAPGKLDVFARGPFAHLWYRSFDGKTWSEWEDLGGDLKSEPAAVSRDSGHIDVFIRGTDDALWQKSYDGTSWSDWLNLGGVLTSGPAACSWSSGRLDVFARGVGNTLWHRAGVFVAGSWKWPAWEDLGGSPIFSSPAAVSWGPDRIDVFARGTDKETGKDTALWHKWWNGAAWLP